MLLTAADGTRIEPHHALELLRHSEDDYSDSRLKPLTPASLDASIDEGETIYVESFPPTSVRITPVIESVNARNHTFGRTTSLAPALLEAIVNTVNALASFTRFTSASHKGNFGCAERYLAAHDTFQTIDQPGCFACKRCFNQRKPCLRMIGNH